MKRLLSQIIAAILGLWLAGAYVPGVIVRLYPESNLFGVALTNQWQTFLVLGIILGLLNFFVRPILKILALPLKFLTLGLFSIVINMAMLWLLDIMFAELYIPWLWPLLYTTIIIWALNIIIGFFLVKKES